MSDENNNFINSDPCPDEQELRSYAYGEMSNSRSGRIIGCHLELCPSCRSQVEKIRKTEVAVDEAIKVFAEKLKRRQEKLVVEEWRGPRPGGIWRTIPESDEELMGPMVFVIEVNESGSLLVAEISEDIPQALHTDMVLEPQTSGLRFRFMIRAGNVLDTVPERLKTFAGELPPPLTAKVIEFCRAAEHFDEEIPLLKYKFGHDSDKTVLMHRKGITSGMLVTQGDDPRLSFLDTSKQRCTYLRITTGVPESGEAVAAMHAPSQEAGGVASGMAKRSLGRRIVSIAAAVAAVLAAVIVTWKGSQTVSDRSMEQLRAEHTKQVEELKAQFATTAEEKAKEMAGLNQAGEILKSKVIALENQNTRLKADIENMSASKVQTENAAISEAESLKNKMAKVEREKEELIKRNAALAASNHETDQQLSEAREAVHRLETEIAAKEKPQTFASAEVIPIDPREGKAVLQAAKAGDLAELRKLVKDWRWADFSDNETWTHPLHLAALNGDLAVANFLLDKGAHVNAEDKDGKTALMLAADKGHRELVKLLLERNADPKLCDRDGRTALYWALKNGHKDIAEDLRSRLGLWQPK